MACQRLRILGGSAYLRTRRRFIRKIAIEKLVPHRLARTDLAFSSAVVGNKKAEIRIRYQVQVAMEILSVAAMSDDAMPISFLFIEAECHGIHVGQVFKLTGMYELRRLRPQNRG